MKKHDQLLEIESAGTEHLRRRVDKRRSIGGVALIEALMALVVLFVAFGTIMAYHGNVVGSAAQNRLFTAAMSLAEDRIESFRALNFNHASLDAGNGTDPLPLTVNTFGLFSSAPIEVDLNRCWVIEDLVEAAAGVAPLKQITVWIERAGVACGAEPSATALAQITTLLAENDMRLAALNTAIDDEFDPDGRGEIRDFTPEEQVQVEGQLGDAPGVEGDPGFKIVTLGEGEKTYIAVVDSDNPTSGLIPDQDGRGQLFATINGNIFLSGRRCSGGSGATETRCELAVITEGNALCRIGYPGSNSDAPPVSPAVMDGVDVEFGYLRYTCVVADQWRRAILVLPDSYFLGNGEKVCVGHPGLVTDPADPNDILRGATRFYDGRSELVDVVDGRIVVVSEEPHGVLGGPWNPRKEHEEAKGKDTTGMVDHASVIGNFCSDGMSCWNDEEIRGMVPAGHHFLVMGKNDGKCSERMLELAELAAIDFHGDVFNFNPGPFYCTSDKYYEGAYCGEDSDENPLTLTRLSGFLEPNAEHVFVHGTTRVSTTSPARACSTFGPFDGAGAGFACIVRHFWGDPDGDILRATSPDAVFAPAQYDGLIARDYPLDLKNVNFRAVAEGP